MTTPERVARLLAAQQWQTIDELATALRLPAPCVEGALGPLWQVHHIQRREDLETGEKRYALRPYKEA